MAIAEPPGFIAATLEKRINAYAPKTDVGRHFKAMMRDPGLSLELRGELLEIVSRIIVMQSQLEVRVFRGLGGTPWIHPGDERWDVQRAIARFGGSYHPLLDPRDPLYKQLFEDYGVVSRKVITNSGVDYLIADFEGAAGSQDVSNCKYHGIGTGTTAEAATQTALVTELTTEYNPDNTRATGSQVVNTAPNPDTYSTVGTNTLDSGTPAVTEHGIFSAASSGTMWDRSLFSAINLVGANGDGLQSTYTLTANAGG